MPTTTNPAGNLDLDNPEFQNAYNVITLTQSSVFLTGRAGTGKSTFLKYILANCNKKTVALAPTGIAAVNIGGVTLHSFFHIPLQPLLPDDTQFIDRGALKERLKYSKEKIDLLRQLQLIVIDEASMVRADVIDFVDLVLRTYTDPRKPFGGKQLLLVGDLYQLEPVAKSEEWDLLRRYYRSAYFFEALVFRRMQLIQIELQKVYRQKQAQFLQLLDRVRTSTTTRQDIDTINTRVKPNYQPPADQMYITLTCRRATTDTINEQQLELIPENPTTFKATIKGEYPEASMPTNNELYLKTGAQIVFVKNDPEHRWYNGTIAQIESIDEKGLWAITEQGNQVFVEPETWENRRYYYDPAEHTIRYQILGSFTQLPVRLAWAITIHKSQGLTFQHVIINLEGGAFANGQTYVALSRCTTLDGIVMQAPITQRDIQTNNTVVNFSQAANNQPQIDQTVSQAKAIALYHSAQRAFDKADYRTATHDFLQALANRPDDLRDPRAPRLLSQILASNDKIRRQLHDTQQQLQQINIATQEFATEYFLLAVECKHKYNDNNAAVANLNKALKLQPHYINALQLRAQIRYDTSQYNDTIADTTTLLQLQPDNTEALRLRASAYQHLQQLLDAEQDLQDALRINDREPATYRQLAHICQLLGEEEQAEQYNHIADSLEGLE